MVMMARCQGRDLVSDCLGVEALEAQQFSDHAVRTLAVSAARAVQGVICAQDIRRRVNELMETYFAREDDDEVHARASVHLCAQRRQ